MNEREIFVEQHFLDPISMMPIGSIRKTFSSLKEFNEYYKLAKTDPCTVINIMNYNPEENSGQKSKFDAKLYATSREITL